MEQSKNEIISYLENATVFLLGILLLLFPVVVITATTDAFIFPKQVMLTGIAFLSLLFSLCRCLVRDKLGGNRPIPLRR